MATYQMIHIAHSPNRNPRAAGSTPGTVGAKGGGIGTRAARPGGNPSSVTFRQRSAGLRIGDRLIGWTEGPRPRLIHKCWRLLPSCLSGSGKSPPDTGALGRA